MFQTKNIIGNGFIAYNFKKIKKEIKNSNYIIYTSGISNSQIQSKKELKREIKKFILFTKKYYLKKIIYISTTSIGDKSRNKSLYVKNKIKIEKIIKKKFKNYIILRLPEIIGISKNKFTLINFFYNNIKQVNHFKVFKNVKRNILDIEDVILILKKIITIKKIKKEVITLSCKFFYNPIDIVKIFEKKLKKKAVYSLINVKKQYWSLNTINYKKNSKYIKLAGITFSKNYLSKTINKYY
jgi:nucleoside-diphosphate-sugar epimerase